MQNLMKNNMSHLYFRKLIEFFNFPRNKSLYLDFLSLPSDRQILQLFYSRMALAEIGFICCCKSNKSYYYVCNPGDV